MAIAIPERRNSPRQKSKASVCLLLMTVGVVLLSYFSFPTWKMGLPTWAVAQASEPVIIPFFFIYLVSLIVLISLPSINAVPASQHRWSLVQLNTRSGMGLLAASIVFVVLQVRNIRLPVLSGPDEPVHILSKLNQWGHLSGEGIELNFALIILFSAVILSIGYLASSIIQSGRFDTLKLITLLVCALALFVLLYAIYHLNEQIPGEWGVSRRWPPLGNLIGISSFWLFGETLVAARLPSLFFYIGIGIVVFRFSAAVHSPGIGLAAAILCFAAPVLFQYSHLDTRDVGGAFFLILGTFYVARYLDTEELNSLLLAAACGGAGYLERRPAGAIVFLIFLAVPYFKILLPIIRKETLEIWSQLKNLCIAGALFLGMVLPWVKVSEGVRPYQPFLDNLLDPTVLLAYLELLPRVVGLPLMLLGLFGVFIAVLRHSMAGIVSVLGFVLLYILFTTDDPYWIPVERFTVLFVPFLSVLAAFTLAMPPTGLRKEVWAGCLVAAAMFPLTMWHTGTNYFSPLVPSVLASRDLPRYPFDQLVADLQAKNIPQGRIFYPFFWQSAFGLYGKLSGLHGYQFVSAEWRPSSERVTSSRQLLEMCADYSCDMLLLAGRVDDGIYHVNGIEDLEFKGPKNHRIPGFEVVEIYRRDGFWISLAAPKNL